MNVNDMLVTLEKVNIAKGKCQLVLTLDDTSVAEIPHLAVMTGQLMSCDLLTAQQQLELSNEE